MKTIFYSSVLGAVVAFVGYILARSTPFTPVGVSTEFQLVSHQVLVAVGLS